MARETNGAESIGAALAAARVRPVSFKNRRLVTRGSLFVLILVPPLSVGWGKSGSGELPRPLNSVFKSIARDKLAGLGSRSLELHTLSDPEAAINVNSCVVVERSGLLKIFITGASGYIGGSVAAALMASGHQVSGLARSDEAAATLAKLGIRPVRGTLDDAEVLGKAAYDADVTVNAAYAGHRAAAKTLIKALTDSGKTFLHTDGSSIVGTRARGELVEKVFDEDTPIMPTPQRAPRVEIDKMVRSAADNGVRSIVIAPSLIYGLGRGLNPHS